MAFFEGIVGALLLDCCCIPLVAVAVRVWRTSLSGNNTWTNKTYHVVRKYYYNSEVFEATRSHTCTKPCVF